MASQFHDFNPRSPCGERQIGTFIHLLLQYFNPRSPCGERRVLDGRPVSQRDFNPRSPCGERPHAGPCCTFPAEFQSTLPVWGATAGAAGDRGGQQISIHAPRVGSDSFPNASISRQLNFNPRSPCGERPQSASNAAQSEQFQSTLPVWGATISILVGLSAK